MLIPHHRIVSYTRTRVCVYVGVERIKGSKVASNVEYDATVFPHCHLPRHWNPGSSLKYLHSNCHRHCQL